jgi:hypothetical protein
MKLSVSKLYSVKFAPGIIRNAKYSLRRTCKLLLQQVAHADAVWRVKGQATSCLCWCALIACSKHSIKGQWLAWRQSGNYGDDMNSDNNTRNIQVQIENKRRRYLHNDDKKPKNWKPGCEARNWQDVIMHLRENSNGWLVVLLLSTSEIPGSNLCPKIEYPEWGFRCVLYLV